MRLLCQHAKAFFAELLFLFGGLRPNWHGGCGQRQSFSGSLDTQLHNLSQ
jgi:hypothetical protein